MGNVGIHSFWWEILEGLGNHRLNMGIGGEMWIHSFRWEIIEGLGNRLNMGIGGENINIHDFRWEIFEGLGNRWGNVGFITLKGLGKGWEITD